MMEGSRFARQSVCPSFFPLEPGSQAPSSPSATIMIESTKAKPKRLGLWLVLCLSLMSGFTSCVQIENKRIRELLNEKGFGTRAQGVATVENYVAGGDQIGFLIEPSVYLRPGAEQLYILAQPQVVGVDGRILIPYVGTLDVLGYTESDLSRVVSTQLQAYFTFPVQVQARVISLGKYIYMFGEIGNGTHVYPLTPDLTVFELLAKVPVSRMANWGKVQLIRPDAENPLTMVINMREMIVTGRMTYNIALQDNDIIYVPPTFFGHITRFLEKLFTPLAVVVRAMFGLSQIQRTYDILFEGGTSYGSGYRF